MEDSPELAAALAAAEKRIDAIRCRSCKALLPQEKFYPSFLREGYYVCEDCARSARKRRSSDSRKAKQEAIQKNPDAALTLLSLAISELTPEQRAMLVRLITAVDGKGR